MCMQVMLAECVYADYGGARIRHTFFFFSSRRRHTRYWRDWSSDVCSSDLGMSERDLIDQLGTIAKSGTQAFMDQATDKNDVRLIGQFGVGFYSAFIVSSRVRSEERRVGKEGRSRGSPDH